MKDSRTGDDAYWIPAHLDFNIDAYTAAGCDGEGFDGTESHHILIVGKDARPEQD
jgi:hypothetical protein